MQKFKLATCNLAHPVGAKAQP